jgi:hypothetical protein
MSPRAATTAIEGPSRASIDASGERTVSAILRLASHRAAAGSAWNSDVLCEIRRAVGFLVHEVVDATADLGRVLVRQRARVHAIPVQRLGSAHVPDAEQRVHAHPVVVVLDALRDVVGTQDAADPPAVHEARPDEVIGKHVQAIDFARQAHGAGNRVCGVLRTPRAVREGIAALVHDVIVGVRHRRVGLPTKLRNHALDLPAVHQVVVGRPRPEFARREQEPVGQRARQLLVRLHHDAHVGVARVTRKHRFDVVGGSIVDDDELDRTIGLRQDRSNRAVQQVCAIVNRQHDAHEARDERRTLRPHRGGSLRIGRTLPLARHVSRDRDRHHRTPGFLGRQHALVEHAPRAARLVGGQRRRKPRRFLSCGGRIVARGSRVALRRLTRPNGNVAVETGHERRAICTVTLASGRASRCRIAGGVGIDVADDRHAAQARKCRMQRTHGLHAGALDPRFEPATISARLSRHAPNPPHRAMKQITVRERAFAELGRA